jgi:hypothetical protein
MFDEIKTHLCDGKKVLRSKTPDLVRQEFYALMLTHAAIRRLMYEAAQDRGQRSAKVRKDAITGRADPNRRTTTKADDFPSEFTACMAVTVKAAVKVAPGSASGVGRLRPTASGSSRPASVIPRRIANGCSPSYTRLSSYPQLRKKACFDEYAHKCKIVAALETYRLGCTLPTLRFLA